MKFVSALLVAIIAMVLVVPALSWGSAYRRGNLDLECAGNYFPCEQGNNASCCGDYECGAGTAAMNNGGPTKYICWPPKTARSQMRNVDLHIFGDGANVDLHYVMKPHGPNVDLHYVPKPHGPNVDLHYVPKPHLPSVDLDAHTQLRKNLLSALTMLEDN